MQAADSGYRVIDGAGGGLLNAFVAYDIRNGIGSMLEIYMELKTQAAERALKESVLTGAAAF